MLHLDELAPRTPQLPHRRKAAQLAASAVLHAALVVVVILIKSPPQAGSESWRVRPAVEQDFRHVVFLAPEPRIGGGGGGGGNEQPGPIRRAQGIGSDPITLRAVKTPPAPAAASRAVEPPSLPSIVLDATPLASGQFEQVGLPAAGVLSGTSTGPGSGGGVGTGTGIGTGPGRGPGLGAGSGGGTGGGAYRPGGAVSAPRLIKEVKPRYTSEALLNKTQGLVVLEVVVTRDGCASQIRVVRPLDRGGLDEQAVLAVSQWLFEPGRLGDVAVDVLVTVEVAFAVR